MKARFYWIAIAVVAYGLTEAASYIGLMHLANFRQLPFRPGDVMGNAQADRVKSYLQNESTYLELDEELGWRIRKSGHNELYQANSAGIRASREYALRAPPNILRIQAFGDSFTHCDDVANEASWQAIMERTYANLEVMNFGVPAYGLDQAYLRYLNDGRRYQPDIVLIGFMTENFFRTVNTYRPFLYLRALPFSKPRYEIKQARLALIPSRLKTPDAVLHPIPARPGR